MPKPYQPQDAYFHKAKDEGYRARSAFKLLEIQEKMKVLKRGNHVLDFGSAPGSWLQVTSGIVGPSGYVLGIDKESITPFEPGITKNEKRPTINVLQADIFSPTIADQIKLEHPDLFKVVLSDLAPKTSGIKDADQYHSIELCERVLELCAVVLKKGGNVVMKVFIGEDFYRFNQQIRLAFKTVKQCKPKASRDRSFETYLVCLGFKG